MRSMRLLLAVSLAIVTFVAVVLLLNSQPVPNYCGPPGPRCQREAHYGEVPWPPVATIDGVAGAVGSLCGPTSSWTPRSAMFPVDSGRSAWGCNEMHLLALHFFPLLSHPPRRLTLSPGATEVGLIVSEPRGSATISVNRDGTIGALPPGTWERLDLFVRRYPANTAFTWRLH